MQLALAEEVAREDALENAERLGEGADAFAVTEDGHGAQVPVQSAGSSSGESALLAWHVLGSVRLERIECPACSAVCEADDESTEIPACPACGVRDTWESRQGPAFRELVEEIGGCSSLEQLALVGKQLYARPLPHEQASVAWSHFQLRKRALEAAVTLGAPARALMVQIEGASPHALGALGARLYRLQHAGGEAPAFTPAEWRRVWASYHARRAPRVA